MFAQEEVESNQKLQSKINEEIAKKDEKKGKKGKEEEIVKKELQNPDAINAINLEK